MKKVILLSYIILGTAILLGQKGGNYHINRIVIDAGHGGNDPGTHGKLYKEKDVALDIALKLGKHINTNNPNVEIIFTRTSDKFVPLFERISIANKAKADLFVSIHCNSSSKKDVKGTETYVMGLHRAEENLEVAQRENEVILLENDYESNYDGYDPNSPVGHIVLSSFQDAYLSQSLEVAAGIEDQLKSQGYTTSRGVKQAGFAVLRRATMPSILIEAGFLSNKEEEKYLGSEKGQNAVSHSIYRALSKYLNPEISAKPTPIPIVKQKNNNQTIIKDITPNNGKSFYVQFAALKSKMDEKKLKNIKKVGEVNVIQQNGYYKYQIVNIPNLDTAKQVKKKLGANGYKGSFIVANK